MLQHLVGILPLWLLQTFNLTANHGDKYNKYALLLTQHLCVIDLDMKKLMTVWRVIWLNQ